VSLRPAISNLRRAGACLTAELELSPDEIPFEGHFPGTPILPAVAQIGWAVNLARDAFPLPVRFSALRSLKFLRVVQPPVRLSIELTLREDGRSVDFVYTHGRTPCASGRIEFADDAAGPDRSFL
jgi:3-hydroxymyristoyl/3-hydroxydecanoyl-(acyl carrier protein) dehydratase